jgi:hypothetical protein
MGCFFSQNNFSTFDANKHYRDDRDIQVQRFEVGSRLLEIHNSLWPWIQQQMWNQQLWDLHPHKNKQHWISSDRLIPNMVSQVSSMWLHYGKNKSQLFDITAFYQHARIEVYIGAHYPNNEKVVRTWLIMTDTTEIDRRNFIKKLNTPAGADRFWALIQPIMNKGYFYETIDCRQGCIQLPDTGAGYPRQLLLTSTVLKDDLIAFIKVGNVGRPGKPGFYSGIAREYHSDDLRLDDSNFIGELKKDFTDLYPLYDFITRVIP